MLIPIDLNCHRDRILDEFSNVLILVITGLSWRSEPALSLIHDAIGRQTLCLLHLLPIVFLVNQNGLSGWPVVISAHLRHQILKQLILLGSGECKVALISQEIILREVNSSGRKFFVTVASVVHYDV